MSNPDSRRTVRQTLQYRGREAVTLYEVCDASGALIEGPTVAVIGFMHGNEPVGGVTLDRLQTRVSQLTCGRVICILANLKARDLELRHTPGGEDMNRLWYRDRLEAIAAADPADLNYEERRVGELAPILEECGVIFDIHSTSRPSPPCLLVRDDRQHAELLAKLGVRRAITGIHEGAILDGGICSSFGLLPGERSSLIGFTFEAGQHTAVRNLERAWAALVRLFWALKMWDEAPPTDAVRAEIYEVIDRFRQAPRGTEPYRFVGYVGGEPGGGRRGGPRSLASFEPIEADEIIVRRGRETVVRADARFTMLMPAPLTDPGTDLFYVAQRRHAGMVAESDHEASLQAAAIERMMDMLSDDAAERGSTFVSFDPRRVLDLCADIAGRCTRLPQGDPHRRLTVVGRGDWGGGEAEERVGKRYRQAMRFAIARGIPVDRVQLLRGAPLGWFDTLTSRAVGDVLEEAHQAAGQRPHGARIFLSLKQPHTVSVLVSGDLDLALRSGDFRHVRVAMVVEAATVEPDADMAHVRVVRAGLFSSRAEFVTMAVALLDAVKREHRSLLAEPDLIPAGLADIVARDGAIVPRTTEDLATLRASLYRLQMRLWGETIRSECPQPLVLETQEEVGRWLAGLMSRTGILDAEALRSLLVRRCEAGWRIDPSVVVDVAPDRPRSKRTRRMPHQVTFSPEVDRDNLERWVGWRRWLASVEEVPDVRGKDVDIEFSDSAIVRRLGGWFAAARQSAIGNEGQVMVIVAGDGLNPEREDVSRFKDLVNRHRTLVLDPRVRYLRILHAQGTHLAWLKDFVGLLDRRGIGGQPVAIHWEVEHGGIVNVVMIAERDPDCADGESLAGWSINRCAVILTDLSGFGSYKVGVFTEKQAGQVNQELLHFGRKHCEGLLTHGNAVDPFQPAHVQKTEIVNTIVQQLTSWVELVRAAEAGGAEITAHWVRDHLGLADRRLCHDLAAHVRSDLSAVAVADELWSSTNPWPGDGLVTTMEGSW